MDNRLVRATISCRVVVWLCGPVRVKPALEIGMRVIYRFQIDVHKQSWMAAIRSYGSRRKTQLKALLFIHLCVTGGLFPEGIAPEKIVSQEWAR